MLVVLLCNTKRAAKIGDRILTNKVLWCCFIGSVFLDLNTFFPLKISATFSSNIKSCPNPYHSDAYF